MITRVFCYSKEIAKKNGNRLPILPLVLSTVLFIFFIILIPVSIEDENLSIVLFILIFLIFLIALFYFSILLGVRMRSRMTGFAVDSNGRIFKAMTVNNGEGLTFSGMAVGGFLDQLAGNNSSLGESVGGMIGATAQFYAMNRSARYMSHPEIVAMMIEKAPNITGAEVFEILRVYSIIDRKNTIKINCDYKIIRKNKIKYRKNMTIEKSYKGYEDLIKFLNAHK